MWYSGWIESDGKREFVLLAGGREALGRTGVRTTFLHNHRHGGEGEHSIRDWRDSAKYLDTTLPLKKFYEEEKHFKRTIY